MPMYYADTSVLVKRHIAEVGSAWVASLADPTVGNAIVTARITLVEIYSALNRRVREGTLQPTDYRTTANDVAAVFATEYQVVELLPQIVTIAIQLLERHPLRAYDAIQLATGLLANAALQSAGAPALTFLVSDGRLRAAAQTEGLTIDDPEAHP